MSLKKSIVLFGIKHSGKSTQAKALSSYYKTSFFDTDDVIKSQTSLSPREFYNKNGKEAFIKAELNACDYVSSIMKQKPIIIATGGGICDNPDAISHLREKSTFIYLDVDFKIACNRILSEISFDKNLIKDMNTVPSYIAKKNPHTKDDVRNIFLEFYNERTKKYLSFVDTIIDQKNLSIRQITDKIINII